MDDLIQYHHDRTADALATMAIRLRDTADEIDRLVAMSPKTDLHDMAKEWTPAVTRSVQHFRAMVGNLGALDAAIESAAIHDRLVRQEAGT